MKHEDSVMLGTTDLRSFSFLPHINNKMTHLQRFHFFAEKTSQFHRHIRNQPASVYRFKRHITFVVFVRLKNFKTKDTSNNIHDKNKFTLCMAFTYVLSFQKTM